MVFARRLINCEDGLANFRWKDYRANDKSKVMTLPACEFIRRFLQHRLSQNSSLRLPR
jgi:hypothetical protein